MAPASGAREIELVEEHDLFLARDQLTDDQAIAIQKNSYFDLDWPNPGNDYRYRIRSRGWVGHVPVGETMLIIHPKVPISNIFQMLELAYDLKGFHLLDGATSVESLLGIYERIAAILARRVLDRVRKGLFRSYVEHLEDLLVLRGRIDLQGNIRNAVSGSPLLHCRFDELTVDLDDNRLLAWALYLASKSGFLGEKARTDVRRAYRALIGSISLHPAEAADCMGRNYNRLNADYQPMHDLCRFIIEQAGPSMVSGGHKFIPFAIDMPKLFESYVAKWLAQHLPQEYDVRVQVRYTPNAISSLTHIPDLVIYDASSDKALLVLDTKYKSDLQPSQSDVDQVNAYAGLAGTNRALLVYPGNQSTPMPIRIANVEISTTSFDLSTDLDMAGADTLKAITTLLNTERERPN